MAKLTYWGVTQRHGKNLAWKRLWVCSSVQKNRLDRWMDGWWMYGQMDGWTDRWTNKQTDMYSIPLHENTVVYLPIEDHLLVPKFEYSSVNITFWVFKVMCMRLCMCGHLFTKILLDGWDGEKAQQLLITDRFFRKPGFNSQHPQSCNSSSRRSNALLASLGTRHAQTYI